MKKCPNNSPLHYLLVLCLSLTLILAQASSVHMHLQHDDHSPADSDPVTYAIDVHIASIQHDVELTNHFENEHSSAFNIGSDNLVKKSNLLPPIVLILIFIGLLLFIPRFVNTHWQRLYKVLFIPYFYLLRPALRAPPL